MNDARKLESFVQRVERLMDDRDDALTDIREVLDEAKDAGFVPKVMRTLIRRRRAKDPDALAREDDLLETYQAMLSAPLARAVAMADQGATSREIEQATGIDHATAARSVALKNKSATKRGEITEQNAAPLAHSVEGPQTDNVAIERVSVTPAPEGGEGAGTHAPVVAVPASAAVGDADGPPPAPAAAIPGDDIGNIPDFLERARVPA